MFFLLAAVAATLASMVVYSSLRKKDEEVRKALAGMTPIVVAAHDIVIGAKIDAGAIKLVRWPRDGLPPGAITDSASVIGSVARSEFAENEPLVAARLVASDKTSGVLPLMIPGDMRAMSVAVDEVSDMAGFILPFTKVDVLLSLTGSQKDSGRSRIFLQDITVLAVAQTIDRRDSPQPERVVTLLVTPDQAERLAVASTQGRLHLVLRSYADDGYVATSGSDLHKVMGGDFGEVPNPVPMHQTTPPVRVAVGRIVRQWRRPLPSIEVLRDGRRHESIVLDRDGRALASASSAASGQPLPDTPSAGVPSLGEDNTGAGGYVEGVAPDRAMAGPGASIYSGGDSQ